MIKIHKLILAAGLTTLQGCAMLGIGGGGANMSTSSKMPAAEGHVAFDTTKNGNTSLDLSVKHLAKPEKLNPPANTYVVWTKASDEAEPQNIGALKVDKNLNGELETETPLHEFEIFITAENSGTVQEPSGERLLWANHKR